MVKSWNLDDLSVDAPSPSPAPAPSDASLVASSLGTSPALFSTPVSTATGSTGGVVYEYCQCPSVLEQSWSTVL